MPIGAAADILSTAAPQSLNVADLRGRSHFELGCATEPNVADLRGRRHFELGCATEPKRCRSARTTVARKDCAVLHTQRCGVLPAAFVRRHSGTLERYDDEERRLVRAVLEVHVHVPDDVVWRWYAGAGATPADPADASRPGPSSPARSTAPGVYSAYRYHRLARREMYTLCERSLTVLAAVAKAVLAAVEASLRSMRVRDQYCAVLTCRTVACSMAPPTLAATWWCATAGGASELQICNRPFDAFCTRETSTRQVDRPHSSTQLCQATDLSVCIGIDL